MSLRGMTTPSLSMKESRNACVGGGVSGGCPPLMQRGILPPSSFSFRWMSTSRALDPSSFFSEGEEDTTVHYPAPQAYIGSAAPTFSSAAVVDGEIVTVDLKDFRDKWVVLLFYPKDFTFVCPTELVAFSDRVQEFEALNAQVVAISTDTAESHLAWTRMARSQGGLGKMSMPLVADGTKSIAARYGVLNEDLGIAFRGLFLINPDGVLEQSTVNNFPVGRSVDETLRLLQAFQYVAEHGEVCPANWTPGSPTMIANPEDSQEYFSKLADGEEETGLEILTKASEVEKIIESGETIMLDFMASWCGKCKQIEPFVAKLAQEHSSIRFIKVDTSTSGMESIKEKYGVSALPTFQAFQKGQAVGNTISGYKKRLLKDEVLALSSSQ